MPPLHHLSPPNMMMSPCNPRGWKSPVLIEERNTKQIQQAERDWCDAQKLPILSISCKKDKSSFILPTLLTSSSSSLQLIVNDSSIATSNSYLSTNWFISSRRSRKISWWDNIPAISSAPCWTHHTVRFPVHMKTPLSGGIAPYNCKDSIGIVCSEI